MKFHRTSTLLFVFLLSNLAPRFSFADSSCHYVYPKIQAGKENSYHFNRTNEQKDVKLVSFHKNKLLFLESPSGARVKSRCQDQFPEYNGPEAACFGLIQCNNNETDLEIKVCKPVSTNECPTAQECMNDQSLVKTVIKSDDANLSKDYGGLAFLISQTNTHSDNGLLILGTTNLATRLNYKMNKKIIPEFDIRFASFPYINGKKTNRKLESITHKEVINPDPKITQTNDLSQCISLRNPDSIGSYPKLPNSHDPENYSEISANSGSAE